MNHVTSIGLDVHARSITAVALDSITGEARSQRSGHAPAEAANWIHPSHIDWSLDAIPDLVLSIGATDMFSKRLFLLEGARIQP